MIFTKIRSSAFLITTLLSVSFLPSFGPAKSEEIRNAPRLVGTNLSNGTPNNQFCENIKDAAQEQRYAIKTKELNQLRDSVEQRIVKLEEKRAELELWQQKRDNFSAKAESAVVEIYSKMRPDAAASRLEILSQSLAAAILLKMSARKAGVILNEMNAERAADITRVLAASGEVDKRS